MSKPKSTASTPTGRAKPAVGRRQDKPLAVVHEAAQKPVHATREAIRHAVKSVTGERRSAHA
jgi:hypothetical protein